MNIEFKISKKPVNYKKAMDFLQKRVTSVNKGGAELVWFLEHPTTFTAGVRHNKNEIIDPAIKIIKTNRGGKITLHNRGQLVVYFVINLNNRRKDVRNLIRQIEKIIIKFLSFYKIKSDADPKNIGIWVKKKKIAAIGIRVSKWIAYHGFSINLENNLNEYKKILPCGLSNINVTSVKNEGVYKIKNINKFMKQSFNFYINKI